MSSELNLKKVPKVVGDEPRKLLKKIYNVVDNTSIPVYITGPSGSGKSIIAMNVAKRYSKEYNVPAYYVQLSPEQTKTSLILGLRLVDGSLEAVNGVVADCMEKGGIIIIDEATHTLQEMLLMFNSILDRTSVTSIGDKIVESKDTFKIIFCANDSKYSGNVKLPQSFAQRLIGYYCDYPTFDDEVKIVKSLSDSECDIELKVPESVLKYVVSIMRSIRTTEYPLSVRNAASAMILLELASKKSDDSEYFLEVSTAESLKKNITSKILQKDIDKLDISDLLNDEVNEFVEYVSKVGIAEFKNIILSSMGYYLDIDFGFYDADRVKESLITSII